MILLFSFEVILNYYQITKSETSNDIQKGTYANTLN